MVFTAALVQPLGVCMIPVMLITLAAMLQGIPVLSALYVWSPIALVVAAIWTWIRTRDVIVEVHMTEDAVAVRSLLEAADPPAPLAWRRLLDARMEGGSKLILTLGHEEFRLLRADWSNADDLFTSLPVSS
jgi:hypothetical protein